MNKNTDDESVKRFCAVLILSALDEARALPQQDHAVLTPEQAQARHFLLARSNRRMMRRLLGAMGIDCHWFFHRVVKRLVQSGWPAIAPDDRHTSRMHGTGLYDFFSKEDKPR
mgnify:FL=1